MMWTDEQEQYLMENWLLAEAKRKEEAAAESLRRKFKCDVPPPILELPQENPTVSYPYTGGGAETSIAMLRRANAGTCHGASAEQALSEAEMGMSQREFDKLSSHRQLVIANAAIFQRMSKK